MNLYSQSHSCEHHSLFKIIILKGQGKLLIWWAPPPTGRQQAHRSAWIVSWLFQCAPWKTSLKRLSFPTWKKPKRARKCERVCVPARVRVPGRLGDLIRKCAVGEHPRRLTLGLLSPQALLSCLTLTEPCFSESPALMENKFRCIRMEPLTSPFSGPETFICFKIHTLISVLQGGRARV